MKLLGFASFLLVSTFFGSASALPLKPFPSQPQFRFDSNLDTPVPTCSELSQRLKNFQENNRDAHFGLIEFMDVSGQRVGEWHRELVAFEGQQTQIPVGAFNELAEGSNSILELTSLAYQNLDYLDRDIESIIEALERCISQGR